VRVYRSIFGLGTGTISTLKPKNAQSLRRLCITLFPDIGAYNKWQEAMKSFYSFCDISISDLLEQKTGEQAKQMGYDLADNLMQYSTIQD